VLAKVANPKIADEAPGFEVVTSGSRSEIPDITVHFANGITQKMVLEQYRGTECNYIGELENTKENVAVTGCLQNPGDKMDITLLSKHSPKHTMFSLDFDRNLHIIENPFNRGATDRSVRINSRQATDADGWTLQGGDEEENAEDEAAEEAIMESAAATTFAFPAKLTATLKFGYESSMASQLLTLGVDFKTFVDSVMTHVQTYYKHSSLGTEVIFDYDASTALFKETTWTAENNLSDASTETAANEDSTMDLYAWWVSECSTPCSGVAGIAWVGTACNSYNGYKTSLNEWQGDWDGKTDAAGSAYVLAHEMGHNLGMSHDFDAKHGGTGDYSTSTNACNNQGIMSYGNNIPNQWSSCSISDFEGYYQLRNWGTTCFDVSDSTDDTDDSGTDDSGTTTVALDMKLSTKSWGNEVSWTFGTCSSLSEGSYGNNQDYSEECTVAPGTYTLTCTDSYGDGWHGGYLTIQGTKYCRDFKSGSSKTVSVTVAAA